MTPKKKLLLFIVHTLFVSNFIFGQNDPNINLYYDWFDKQVGNENININNGKFHKETFKTLNKSHQYFKDQKFSHGRIIYDGNIYSNILIKYDIFSNKLIVKLPNQQGHDLIILSNNLIDEFSIKQHHFIKHITNNGQPFFYEIIFKNNINTLFKKNIKTRRELFENSTIYSYFKSRNKYTLLYKNEYHDLNTKKDFIKVFKTSKKQINSFYGTNKSFLKSNPEGFKINLLNRLLKSI